MPLHNPVSEKIESLTYIPGLQDTTDLEPATKTITATLEASGLANADYNKALTLPKPEDKRLVVKRIVARLQVTIDTIPTGDTNLYCRVYVDAQDADHLLFDKDWTTTGDQLDAVDTHSEAKATIFNLLKDGASHTFYFFFWKAGTGTGIVISLVQLWDGVGSCDSPWYTAGKCLDLTFEGSVLYLIVPDLVGTGSPTTAPFEKGYDLGDASFQRSSGYINEPIPSKIVLCKDGVSVSTGGSVSTDLNCITSFIFILRSEQ